MTLPFSVEELETAVSDGDVTKRPHPTLPYFIYNYSPEVQFSKKWNRVTRACRGLILDEDYNIIARPWEKFFNLGEVELPFQFTDPVEVMDKADGSLGILYQVGEKDYQIATRGSFMSEQAAKGTEILYRNYRQDFPNLDAVTGDHTLLFEIIYPSNRIVLDYDGMEDLILLGAVENATGYYLSPVHAQAISGWNGPVVETYDFPNITTALGEMGRKNKEGYVVRRGNFMVKIKEPDYLDLHRLVTNCSPKTVWEQLKDGKSITQICSAFPDEFHGMVKGFAEPLERQYESHLQGILASYDYCLQMVHRRYGLEATRADYARVFKKHPQARYFFLLLDNRSVNDVLWQELKPKAKE